MPVILADETAWDAWLAGDIETALKLQQPLPANRLAVVATGQRQDAA
jgi:putative SOS response-associated peptidase YedK